MWIQQEIILKSQPRGFHLITHEILQKLNSLDAFKIGLMNIFIKHTSASLTINENADPTVRQDFENFFNHSIPENESYYLHQDEGSDDLPAHFKTSILGNNITIPILNGRLNLGT